MRRQAAYEAVHVLGCCHRLQCIHEAQQLVVLWKEGGRQDRVCRVWYEAGLVLAECPVGQVRVAIAACQRQQAPNSLGEGGTGTATVHDGSIQVLRQQSLQHSSSASATRKCRHHAEYLAVRFSVMAAYHMDAFPPSSRQPI